MGSCCCCRKREPGSENKKVESRKKLDSKHGNPRSSGHQRTRKVPLENISSADRTYQNLLEEKVRELEKNLEQNICIKANLSDFEILGYLSKGAFGMVFKVQHLETSEFYALKVQSKQDVVHRRKVEQVITEKKILAAVDHVFIVKLHYAFQDNAAVYLVLELAPCGDFLRLLSQRCHLSEEHAKIYAAQVVLALEYLHAAKILFRDLKPENILVDQTGYLKITDFGYAKRVVGTTRSFCGTLEYLSPEQVYKKPYSRSVDWWATGVLIYEMLHGHSPFAVPGDDDKLIERIKKDDVPFHDSIPLTPEAKSIILGLLDKEVKTRLGVVTNGAKVVKRHEWFASIRFVDVYHKNYPAPFVPHILMRVKPYRTEDFPAAATDRYRNEFAEF